MIRAFFISGCLVALGLLVYAGWIEPRQLHIRDVEIGEGARTVRIALMTDLHIGGLHVPPDRVATIVEQINAEAPDIILLPGDFINGHTPREVMNAEQKKRLADGLSHFSGFSAPAIATTGNHDGWHNRRVVTRMLEDAGVSVIDNAATLYDNICIVGVADFYTDKPTAAGFELCVDNAPMIALMHSPDTRSLLPPEAVLAVAGHTHGGQVNLPLIGRRVTSTVCGQPCAYGLIQTEPPLFVSAGVGTSILPIRFRSPPEIVMITLRLPE
ncbi:phosphohydrolase [Algimonas arctica]|uniref:Phosphohydrolase n=1 Tax=Algimonas arctica TaxID=1479486 RepID=A0A8J3G1X6_9PROT|nr:metallophosphoesterase [Algimonas arctica]GHA91492.1 phosphohydrolase [Algimonas arctica]